MAKTVIVGDVHGCRDELDALLDRTAFACGDTLVFVGDLIARGPDTLGVLDIARQTGAIVVRGNHEHRLVSFAEELDDGKDEARALARLPRLHREIARALRPVDWTLLVTSPFFHDLPEHAARVVHAGVDPLVPWAYQDEETLLRIRTIRADNGVRVLWGQAYLGPPHVLFGHNAAPGLQLHAWATGLDTGCVYGGRLSAMVLGEGQRIPKLASLRKELLVSVPARRVYYDYTRDAA
jgi:hypothetical protein